MQLHRKNHWMLCESLTIFVLLFAASFASVAWERPDIGIPAATLQGLWFQRLYVIGHESAHRRLAPGRTSRRLNDALGQMALVPILVPIDVFRAIHAFHHGANRRDARSAALDVYVVPRGAGPLRRFVPWVTWYVAVFAGGWFVHGLVSVILFLFVPPRLARRVSPAFEGWTAKDQLRSSVGFGLGLGLHIGVGSYFGATVWWWTLGLPLLVFAWVYSVQLYAYHYRTTMGPAVRFHARSVTAHRLTRWWLLELPCHATHHRHPSIPWYELRAHELEQPPVPPDAPVQSWLGAVVQQAMGPTIVEAEAKVPA